MQGFRPSLRVAQVRTSLRAPVEALSFAGPFGASKKEFKLAIILGFRV